MKMPVAFKSLLAVTALTAACAANASTYALPQGAPGLFQVSSNTFEDSFTFNVTSLSSLVGGVGSRDLDFGFVTVQALNFSELSLTGPGLNVSYTGNAATFSATSLGVGSYTLTVKGAAPSGGGLYSLYGNLAPVPEPESYAMFLAGLGIVGAVARRRRKSI